MRVPPSIESAKSLSPARLMSVPLDVLLREVGAELVESRIDDPGFLGAVVVRQRGGLALSLLEGLGEAERDLVARCLLGQALGLDMAPLPGRLRVERH